MLLTMTDTDVQLHKANYAGFVAITWECGNTKRSSRSTRNSC